MDFVHSLSRFVLLDFYKIDVSLVQEILTVMLTEQEQLKSFLLSIYFPQNTYQNLDAVQVRMKSIESKFLKWLCLPEKFHTDFYLIARFEDNKEKKKKIIYEEKDSIKYLIKLIYEVKQN